MEDAAALEDAVSLAHRQAGFPRELEVVATCDLCGGTRQRQVATYHEYLLFTGESFCLVRCEDCGLSFLNPRPTVRSIGFYYPPDYLAHREEARPLRRWQSAVGAPTAARPWGLRRLLLHIRQSMHWYSIPRFEGGGRALDIGCGSGKLLDTLRALGWDTHGVDPSAAALERARQRGHDTTIGRAEDAPPAGEYDLVYLWHALEHTHEPSRVLANVRAAMRPGGRFHLAVPNLRSFHARLFGRCWWSTDAPRHLYQFDRRTLRRYLEEAGFVDIRMTTRTGASSWLRGVRQTINWIFGTRLRRDPGWLLELCEIPVVLSSLFRFFGVGSELRVTCRAPSERPAFAKLAAVREH